MDRNLRTNNTETPLRCPKCEGVNLRDGPYDWGFCITLVICQDCGYTGHPREFERSDR